MKIIKIIKKNVTSLGITVFSVLLILINDFSGIFQSLELKVLDFAFGLRGPTSGWMSQHNLHEEKSDIVLVDLDDESYRLIPWTYPYPRGDMWARVLENLSLAGAKVIVFDIEFIAKDQKSEFSGVDLDTEAARLLEQQQAYQALARVLSTAKEMMDTLLRSM